MKEIEQSIDDVTGSGVGTGKPPLLSFKLENRAINLCSINLLQNGRKRTAFAGYFSSISKEQNDGCYDSRSFYVAFLW